MSTADFVFYCVGIGARKEGPGPFTELELRLRVVPKKGEEEAALRFWHEHQILGAPLEASVTSPLPKRGPRPFGRFTQYKDLGLAHQWLGNAPASPFIEIVPGASLHAGYHVTGEEIEEARRQLAEIGK